MTDARKKLLDTGKYEEYVDATGKTDIRLKQPSVSTNANKPNASSAVDAIKGVTGMIKNIVGLPGMNTAIDTVNKNLDAASNYISSPQSKQIVEPAVDPYVVMMKQYQDQINALSMETDPDYNENLEQLSPDELEKEIL